MSWIEFLEAMARIAEKASLKPIGKENDVNFDISINYQEMSYEQRFAQPLHYKLEALLVRSIVKVVDDDYKKNNQLTIPAISMFDVVEEDEYY